MKRPSYCSRSLLLIVIMLALEGSNSAHGQTTNRLVMNFNQSWKFQLGDYGGAQSNSYNDTLWNTVGLPHSFDIPYFGWNQFYTGYGWYRKHFTVPVDWSGKRVFLEFEAAFQDAQVYVNGQLVGEHLGGYTGFSYDISSNLVVGDNVVAVRLNNNWNPQQAPRTGDHTFIGGIYRDVNLVVTDPLHVTWYGTWVTTPTLAASTGASSTVNIQTEILNNYITNVSCTVQTLILDANSNIVATVSSTNTIPAGATNTFNQTTTSISNPNLWSPTTPYLYSAATTVFNGTNVVDSYNTSFGFRWFQWTATNGFYLNGSHLFFHGADVHQDHAGWSDAATDAGAARDVGLVKQAGFDFIRGSHYPHSPSFADACDTNGVCLWSEFPFWGVGGGTGEGGWLSSSSYPTLVPNQAPFEASVKQGLTEEIRVLRNHPSIIAWSMCNEPFFCDASVENQMSNLLSEEVVWTHQLDPTRPAALGGCQRPDTAASRIDLIGDVAGYNGDGAAIALFQNPGIPNLVTEYDNPGSVRPGSYNPSWGNLVTSNGLPIEYAWRSGQVLWCAFNYGTDLGGGALPGGEGTGGIIDFFRLPKQEWYWYRNQYAGVPPPAAPGGGTPAALQLTADKTNILAVDGMDDSQLIVTVLDANGNATSNNVPVTLTVISGPGQFPTGTNITFTPPSSNQASDIAILAGKAAIEFRTYYSGTTVIQATSPGLASTNITITSQGSPTWVPGVTPPAQTLPYSRFNGTVTLPPVHSYQLALNEPATSSSSVGAAANANDGDTNTVWQAASSDSNAWWQVAFQGGFQVDSVQLVFPAPGNYQYQILVSADNVNWTTVVDQSQNSDSDQSRTAVGHFGSGIGYLRVQLTNMPPGLVPGLAEVTVGGGSGLTYNAGQLGGTIIGTDGSSNNVAANVKEAAMDWNTNTFFDGPDANGDWVGLDLGSTLKTNLVTVGYYPRIDSATNSNFSGRMVGGIFQGANLRDFSDAVNLFTIAGVPEQGAMTLQTITNITAFRYVRCLSGTNGFCNVAELEFFQGVVFGPDVVWSGAVSGTWDTATANWLNNAASATYQDGDSVQFDDTALGNTTVGVSGSVAPTSVVVNNSALTYAISGGAITGTGSLIKLGSGTLTLNGANTFSGGVTESGGIIILAGSTSGNAGSVTAGPVGTGTINLSGGALSVDSGAIRTIANDLAITTGTTNIFGSSVASQNFTLNGALSGGGMLQNQSVTPAVSYSVFLLGDLSLFTGTIIYTGVTGGNGANWRLGTSGGTSDLSQAAVVLNGGNSKNFGFQDNQNAVTLKLGSLAGNGYFQGAYGGSTVDSVLVGYLNTSTIFSGQVGVSGNNMANFGLTKVGTGTLTLIGTNIYTGQTTVSNGELVVSTVFAGKGSFVVNDGATLGVTNLSTTSASISNLTLGMSGPTTLEFQNVSNLTKALFSISNLTLNGSCAVRTTGTNNLAVGNIYPLINYAGNFTGSFANFHLQMPAGYLGNVVSNAHMVSLNISGVVPLPAVPANLVAIAGNGQVTSSWSAANGATGYNFKRSTTNDGPYAVIAGNMSGLAYTNSGLANGTMYYFVVSATNSAGEGANSTQVSARPVSPIPTNFTFATSSGQLQLNWPVDHTGWRLQAQTNSLNGGLGTNWVDVSSNLVMNTNQVTIPLNPTNSSVFFRLVYP